MFKKFTFKYDKVMLTYLEKIEIMEIVFVRTIEVIAACTYITNEEKNGTYKWSIVCMNI